MTSPSPLELDKISAVLRPPYIPGMTEMPDQPPYDGGIPLRAVEGDLQVIINAWETMNIGDRVEMFWGNSSAPVWSKTIELGSELNKDVVFRIPEGFILDGDATPVFYRITRPTQGPQDSTPTLTLLVKRTRPGGLDDSPEPGHDGLKYTLTPDISNGVDPSMAEQGVQMRIEPYENITVYDRIIARWGSQEVVHSRVTQEEIDDPTNHPILITFTKAVIEAAGDGPRVAVTYQVIDRCNNYPDERAPWAAYTYVLVDLGGNRLNAPLVLVEGRPTNTIDLELLGEADVIVRVYTPETDFAVGDKVRMTWSGTPAEGGPIVVGPLEQTVEFVPFHRDFLIPNASVKAIAKGWATVSYQRVRDGVANRPSKNASVDVVGEISHLLPPSVDEAPGGTLPPETLWATVKLPWYPGRQRNDLVNLIWEAKRGDSTVYYDDPRSVGDVHEHEPILRSVSNAEIRRFDGLKVKVYYRVANDDALVRSVRESQPLWMQVGEVAPQFVRPEVDEVEPGSDVLDPVNVPPTGATLIMPFLGTQAGDRVTYRWRGSASGGSTSDFVDLTSQTAEKVVRFTIAKSYVVANLDGRVCADYNIVRDGSTLGYSFELNMRVGSLETLKPMIVSASDSNGKDISNDGTVSDNQLTLEGTAVADAVLEILDGVEVLKEVQVGSSNVWRSPLLSISVGQHRFTVREKQDHSLVSDPWAIERLALKIEQTQMTLNGLSMKIPEWPKTGRDSLGNTDIRIPTGGVPPYSYASSAPLTASVVGGKVTGLKNGVATIYVTDKEGVSLSYLVAVTNVYQLKISDQPLNIAQSIEWMNLLGGKTTYNYSFRDDILRVYIVPEHGSIWTCSANGRWGNLLKPNNSFTGLLSGIALEAWCLTSL
ncbi:hypothetical protein ACYZT8_17890 [Pseudomonas sp. LB3P93]